MLWRPAPELVTSLSAGIIEECSVSECDGRKVRWWCGGGPIRRAVK